MLFSVHAWVTWNATDEKSEAASQRQGIILCDVHVSKRLMFHSSKLSLYFHTDLGFFSSDFLKFEN